jgi:selenocysteine-specific elongation factor
LSTTPEIFNAVIGTAGHIDHGKSTLVQQLTGIHPDRLKEEQERGITIDLGFAPLKLKNGMRVGIIDVPGHEKFIKNMVAGATGIDFVLMVVAADDGVMAQTREHLQIIQLLGVRDGLTVITKKDLAEPDVLELVIEDVKALEVGTVLDGKPVIAVSARNGEGIAELRAKLDELLPRISRRGSTGPFRMPIQRVFAKEGFGTVVTGVPLSGQVKIGDALEVLPPHYSGRVKGLHAYKLSIEHGYAGHSTAVNLHGPEIDKREIVRGMVAATPGVFSPTKLLTAHLQHLPSAPWPLKHRAPIRFHSGTAELQGKVLVLDGEALAPGQSGFIQILLEDQTVAAPGDHYLLRHQTPMVTLGGGRIVDVVPLKRKRGDPGVIAELTQRQARLDNFQQFLEYILVTAELPKPLQELSAETGLLPAQITELLAPLLKDGRVVALKSGSSYLAKSLLSSLGTSVCACIQDFLKEHPALGGVERPELKTRLRKKIGTAIDEYSDDVLELLNQHGAIKAESNLIALPGRERKLEGALAATAQKIESALKSGALGPPTIPELQAQLTVPPKTLKEILRFLIDTRAVAEATPEIYFHREPLDKAKLDLQKLFAAKSERTTSEIRQHLGMNRKFVIPLVELLDRTKFTVRAGDIRKLK